MAQWTTSEAWINYQRVSILDLRKRMGVYRTDLEFTETQRGEGEAGGKSERNPSLHSQTVTDQRAGSTDYQNHGRLAAMSVMYGKYRALQKNWLGGDCALRPCCPRGHWTSRVRATCVFDMFFLEKEGTSRAGHSDYSSTLSLSRA